MNTSYKKPMLIDELAEKFPKYHPDDIISLIEKEDSVMFVRQDGKTWFFPRCVEYVRENLHKIRPIGRRRKQNLPGYNRAFRKSPYYVKKSKAAFLYQEYKQAEYELERYATLPNHEKIYYREEIIALKQRMALLSQSLNYA